MKGRQMRIRMRQLVFVVLAMLGSALPLRAQYEWTSSRPDGHAPIGVMGEHMHSKGEFMLSYRFMSMPMTANRTGADKVTTQDVLKNFMVSPTNMPMAMHMAGLMYAPSDRVTTMVMGNWHSYSMDHETRMGGKFTTTSSGLGDTRLGALVGLKQSGSTRTHLNLAVSIPTGSIEQMDVTPMSGGNPLQLPYPMQLGSGTWDLLPGITFLGMTERTSWGMQALGNFRLGENSRGYARGTSMEGTVWYAVKPHDRISLSVRLCAKTWGDYSGHDEAFMNPMVVPTVREDLRGGRRIDLPLGLNFQFPAGVLGGHRLAVEWSLPIYQSLNGPQLQTDWILTLGWQKSFEPIGGHH